MASLTNPLRFLDSHRTQLVKRIKGLKLNSGPSIDLGRWHAGCDSLDHPLRPLIAIADGWSHAVMFGIKQNIVHGPTIYANTADWNHISRFCDGLAQMLLDRIDIPAQVCAARFFCKGSREAAQFMQPQEPLDDLCGNHASAACTQVGRNITGKLR